MPCITVMELGTSYDVTVLIFACSTVSGNEAM